MYFFLPQDIAVVGRCVVLFSFFWYFYLHAQNGRAADLILTNPPPPSPLPIYPNLLMANNFVGILNASGFSLLVPTTLSHSFPRLFFYYCSKGKYHVEIYYIARSLFVILLCQ